MRLDDWLSSGDLQRQPASRTEIARLCDIVARDLADAQATALSVDGRFNTAYDAAYALCLIVLRAAGYRVRGSSAGHHWLAFALLPEIMGPAAGARARYYQACRRKRHQATYERTGVASAVELEELMRDVAAFRAEVLAWLKQHHPDLAGPDGTGQC